MLLQVAEGVQCHSATFQSDHIPKMYMEEAIRLGYKIFEPDTDLPLPEPADPEFEPKATCPPHVWRSGGYDVTLPEVDASVMLEHLGAADMESLVASVGSLDAPGREAAFLLVGSCCLGPCMGACVPRWAHVRRVEFVWAPAWQA
jgi:hypothetical protein